MDKNLSSYRVGEWTIDPGRGMARRGDESVHLEPKAVELLNYLVSRPGEVISRAELMDMVWPNVIVGDDVITNTVAKLRRSLQDNKKSSRLIETIPKRGYRVAASAPVIGTDGSSTPVTRLHWIMLLGALLVLAVIAHLPGPPQDSLDGETGIGTIPLPDKPSIAVLPLANLSDDNRYEYFVDGITEDLIADLSRVSNLFVIARSSSFHYKGRAVDYQEVGNELGVRYLVDGGVHKVGNKLRIDVRLVDTLNDVQTWSETYDGDITGVFAFQDELREKIVHLLSVEMTGFERDYAGFQETHKHSAYEAFLEGWAAFRRDTPEDYTKALIHFERALQEDPAYGRAFAALAAIYWETYSRRWHRRLDISPIYAVWERVNEYLERSMIAPTPLAHKVASAMLTMNRRYDEAVAEARRAIAIDSNDPLGYVALADVFNYAGVPDEAEAVIMKAMRLDPQDQGAYYMSLGIAKLVKGEAQGAIALLQRATLRSPDNRLAWMMLISAYGAIGDVEKGKAALETLDNLQRRDKLVSFTVARAREHMPFKMPDDRDRILDGLRKVGVPEW